MGTHGETSRDLAQHLSFHLPLRAYFGDKQKAGASKAFIQDFSFNLIIEVCFPRDKICVTFDKPYLLAQSTLMYQLNIFTEPNKRVLVQEAKTASVSITQRCRKSQQRPQSPWGAANSEAPLNFTPGRDMSSAGEQRTCLVVDF